jgi:glycosyltransferase involved in cell wall biosynthesis
MVLSGNIDEDVISKGFDLGIEDYMKKPLSMSEISARIKRLIGSNSEIIITENSKFDSKQQYIPNKQIGIVIPCYNEEKRLLSNEFINFAHINLGYHLCFVNDGSSDKTLEVLEQLRKGKEDYISIYDCEKNGGKAEAVRLGMLHLAKQSQFDYIGFLDADLSTNFDDFQNLADTIYNSKYKLVFGSRITRMGAEITKESARSIISKTINLVIRKIIGMEINDTQCGAKIMTRDLVKRTFRRKFITKWLFDVEIFLRIKKIYGLEKTKKIILEKPLNRWIHVNGSKLSSKDSFKIVGQTFQIAFHYNLY